MPDTSVPPDAAPLDATTDADASRPMDGGARDALPSDGMVPGDAGADALPADATVPGDAGPDAMGPGDAGPEAAFDHFVFSFDPVDILRGEPFTLTVTAYASSDDSAPLTGYDGTLEVTVSVGGVSGDTTATVTGGQATPTLTLDTAASGVTIHVSDPDRPSIAGTTAPFRVGLSGAVSRRVTINEVNWFGNADSADEWIELRNVSGGAIDLGGWTIDNAGTGGTSVVIDSVVLSDGEYAIVAEKQGPDAVGSRTSLTGVSNVQLHSLGLANAGEQLRLRDWDGTLVDATPVGAWPAGDDGLDRSMERRDDLTGGGYTDGTAAEAWYTWNPDDGTDTTHAETTDSGTPGAANSDPNATPP